MANLLKYLGLGFAMAYAVQFGFPKVSDYTKEPGRFMMASDAGIVAMVLVRLALGAGAFAVVRFLK